MVRAIAVLASLAVGCTGAVEAEPATDAEPAAEPDATSFDRMPAGLVASQLVSECDVCGLAEALPPEDICSLICDPDALAERAREMLGAGICYHLYCPLSDGCTVSVGVCQ